ncbi:MAG TPA: Ni/Fe hydrogenase subunit beta [Chloroflexi bacterium]|nr:Ni/Fe hydrogenase subunit beta [Chloroflexota bacterium]
MPLKILPKESVPLFVDNLLRDYEVIGPLRKDGFYVFGSVRSFSDMELDYPITIYPAKKFFLPPRESLLRFKTGEKVSVEPVVEEPQPKVLFGLHPCDLHSTWLLDAAFLQETPDASYEARRRHTVFVGLDCLKPCDEYAFCKDMGTLYVNGGYDLFLTDIGDAYAVDIGSKRGEEMLERYADTREPTPSELKRLEAAHKEKEENFSNRLKFDIHNLPAILWNSYDSPYWEELAQKCLGCGSCTLVCSTCYCFDVFDKVELNLQKGERIRVWDSCLLEEFAKVAGGLNFRPSRVERLRHRFFRKGKYLTERFGKVGCVGCGRCTRNCLVHINPIEVYNHIYEEQQKSAA